MRKPCALMMAGGTGGHIFPGLAVAELLRQRGWRVHWLGNAESMEARIVPAKGFPLETIEMSGVRGKGGTSFLLLPFRLLRAFFESVRIIRRVRPDILIGMGGYVTFPGAMMGVLLGKPLLLHEQNAIAGLSNRVLSGIADKVFSAFPGVLPKARWVGNPLREDFHRQGMPSARFDGRSGPLRLLVVGGSLGAKALNDLVPAALALIPAQERPIVVHQSGSKQIENLRSSYEAAGVEAELVPFIDDMASAFAKADLIVCRAGASTVTEIAAVGAAALFVPFPFAVDDHQTANARFLSEGGAAWLEQQSDLTPDRLAATLQALSRDDLRAKAQAAWTKRKLDACDEMVAACEELVQ